MADVNNMTADELNDYAARGLLEKYREDNPGGEWPAQTGDEIVSDMKVEAERVGGSNPATGIYRHCGVKAGDTWVERVERLNELVDNLLARLALQLSAEEATAVKNAKGLVVTFQGTANEGLIRLVTDTLRQFRGVAAVDPVPEDGIGDYITRRSVERDIWDKIRQVFQ